MIHYLRALAAKLRGLFGDRRADQELDGEIKTHLRLLAERYVRQGMTEAEAAWAARRQFGNVTLLKEANREMRGIRFIETLFQDLRYGLWMLRRNPGFTCVAVLTLSLGIGANTAIFSVVNAVLLKPLPYPDPQRLVWISEIAGGAEMNSAADYLHWQEQSQTFDHLVAFTSGPIYLMGRGEPERLDAVWAASNLFPALGVAPQLGRAFTLEEDRSGGGPVVILSHALWQRRFGGDPSIIGQSVTLNGRDRQVIGVMPPGFKFIHKADALLPLALDVQEALRSESKGGMDFLGNIVGRLKSGVSVKQAQSELYSIVQRIALEKTNHFPVKLITVKVTPLAEKLFGNLRLGLLAQFGAVGFILLIACANVANLLLARTNVRQKEMAIRAAMGARRARLVRQMLTESLLLSVFGGVAGLFLALIGVQALAPLIPDNLAHLKESGIDDAALGFTFLASLLTGVVAGVIPALQASRTDLNESLKEGARSAAFSKRQGARRVSPVLVVGELALSLALLTGAGLLIRSYMRVQAVNPGFNPENLLTMRVLLRTARIPLAQRKIIYQDLLTRINTLPGVKAAAIGPIPLTEIRAATSDASESDSLTNVNVQLVGGDYFRTMGMQLRTGRSFTELDNENTPPVVVINEAAARSIYFKEDPIGKLVPYQLLGREIKGTIVGVVANVKSYGLETNAELVEYRSLLQNPHELNGDIELLVRTAGDPLNWAPAVRQQVRAINANIPVVDVMSMKQRLAKSLERRRFQMLLFGLFAAVALVIATIGIYGVISYAVSQRTHEIGIRMALGAQANDVLRMVVWRGMSLALIGVVLGLAGALALTRVMKNLLFNVSATDPATLAGVAILLIGVALIASYIPARRATKVDPLQALRHE